MAVVGRWGAGAWGARDREGRGGRGRAAAQPQPAGWGGGAQGELAGLMVGLLASERL